MTLVRLSTLMRTRDWFWMVAQPTDNLVLNAIYFSSSSIVFLFKWFPAQALFLSSAMYQLWIWPLILNGPACLESTPDGFLQLEDCRGTVWSLSLHPEYGDALSVPGCWMMWQLLQQWQQLPRTHLPFLRSGFLLSLTVRVHLSHQYSVSQRLWSSKV